MFFTYHGDPDYVLQCNCNPAVIYRCLTGPQIKACLLISRDACKSSSDWSIQLSITHFFKVKAICVYVFESH